LLVHHSVPKRGIPSRQGHYLHVPEEAYQERGLFPGNLVPTVLVQVDTTGVALELVGQVIPAGGRSRRLPGWCRPRWPDLDHAVAGGEQAASNVPPPKPQVEDHDGRVVQIVHRIRWRDDRFRTRVPPAPRSPWWQPDQTFADRFRAAACLCRAAQQRPPPDAYPPTAAPTRSSAAGGPAPTVRVSSPRRGSAWRGRTRAR